MKNFFSQMWLPSVLCLIILGVVIYTSFVKGKKTEDTPETPAEEKPAEE